MTEISTTVTLSSPEVKSGEAARMMEPITPYEPETDQKFRVGIGAQLYLVLLGSVLITLMASLVAYFSFNETLRHESRLAEYSMPNLINSVDIARQSAVVVNGAFLLVAASSRQEHEAVVITVDQERAALGNIIRDLESRSAFGEYTRLIKEHLLDLGIHLEVIQESSARRLTINQSLTLLAEELAATNRRIEHTLVQSTDDQGFYLVEGLRSLDDREHSINERASEDELTAYRNLTTVNHQANLAVLLLDEALVLSDRHLLPTLQERFHSAVQNFLHIYSKLPVSMKNNLLSKDLERLGEIGEGSKGIIPLRREVLERLEQEQNALVEVRSESELLVAEVNNLVTQINDEAISSSTAARAAASTGILLLVLLNILSTVGAILFGWLFVGRYLVRRLIGLAGAMRQMASGDLEVPVEVSGKDEVTDMAKALEVFRRYAHEVQRLNLVEKLAQELDAKNETLEQTLKNLETAQEQIIAEQKLSSLGQLTAGVAHEIKNPLNFVDNFSAVAIELTEEIEELMGVEENKESDDSEGDAADADEEPMVLQEDDVEEIKSILSELRLSLGKIREHSKRADGIVHSMLEHSRSEAGEWRETDINAMLKQYVELAYHALRADDSSFNMAMTFDMDTDIGMLKVVPQDIVRVFLNLATNACQALNEKQQQSSIDYEPGLWVTSRLLSENAEFCIRDNGPGIPEELRQKVFEPFMTTKPPGKGTGLGLSLTADILIRHGGSIHLDTEEGEFTEMCVQLPLEPPPNLASK